MNEESPEEGFLSAEELDTEEDEKEVNLIINNSHSTGEQNNENSQSDGVSSRSHTLNPRSSVSCSSTVSSGEAGVVAAITRCSCSMGEGSGENVVKGSECGSNSGGNSSSGGVSGNVKDQSASQSVSSDTRCFGRDDTSNRRIDSSSCGGGSGNTNVSRVSSNSETNSVKSTSRKSKETGRKISNSVFNQINGSRLFRRHPFNGKKTADTSKRKDSEKSPISVSTSSSSLSTGSASAVYSSIASASTSTTSPALTSKFSMTLSSSFLRSTPDTVEVKSPLSSSRGKKKFGDEDKEDGCNNSSGNGGGGKNLLRNTVSKIGAKFETLTLAKFDDSHNTRGDSTDQELDQGDLKATKDSLGVSRILRQMTESARSALFTTLGGRHPIASNQVRVQVHKKNMQCLSDLRLVQIIAAHTGPIWSFRFNHDSTLLATAGQDSVVRVWAVLGSAAAKEHSKLWPISIAPETVLAQQGGQLVLHPVPLRMFSGHKADVIDLSWSKQDFLLSASIDKTARLWHASRERCLCVFQHPDYVTSVAFHPLADRFFVSGSFGKTLRIWNIPEHRVMNWAQTGNVITSATFSPNGQVVVAGLYDGRVMLYKTEPTLKHYTQIDCRNSSGKYSKGKKVTGLQYSSDSKFLLVTTNDSRIRLYAMDDFSLVAKYKGLVNEDLQIKAFFSEDSTQVIAGSQDAKVYVWDTFSSYVPAFNPAFVGGKARRNHSFEVFAASDETVTSAQFVPRSAVEMAIQAAKDAAASGMLVEEQACPDYLSAHIQHCMLAVDDVGKLRIFFNLGKPVNV